MGEILKRDNTEDDLFNSNVILLAPNSVTNDNLFITQDWWDRNKFKKAVEFRNLAVSLGLIRDGLFTLESQLIVNSIATPNDKYQPVIVAPFQRVNSKGEIINCYIVLNGHHRLWVARMNDISIEVVIDDSHELGNLGPIRGLKDLNKIVSSKWNGQLIKVIRNRGVQSDLSRYVDNSES